ncbi:MAG: apolipoprotein N-acyltransferase [Bryobacterales bacterium]|nr:apolipoprotein N-acyltransferase [Bryobacterales bacterium]
MSSVKGWLRKDISLRPEHRRALAVVLAMLSGLLLFLTFPDANFTFLAPVALTPLIVAVSMIHRPFPRFFLGWICGIIYWLGACYWIQDTLATYGDLNLGLSMLALALFALAKGLHMAVFGMAAGYLMQRWWAIPSTAAAWVAIERTHGPLGFAWLTLGNAGIDMPLLLRAAPVVGVYGLSFAFVVMSAALAVVLLRRTRRQLLWVLPLFALYLLPPVPERETGSQQALLVQPNILDRDDWTSTSVRAMQDRVFSLSSSGLRVLKIIGNPLVLWPEVPAPLHYYDDPGFRERTHEFARQHKAWFLFGTIGRTPEHRAQNTAVLINPNGEFAGHYDKMFLVPFGEFVPPLFEWVGKVSNYAGNFVPGEKAVVFPVRSYKLSAIICYESAFPHLVRRFVNDGAEAIANLSFDGYFGNASARRQHLLLARMRAAENARWLLRATSDGITVSIDPAGRIIDSLPVGVAAALPARFNYREEKTPYTKYGDWFCVVCAVLALAALAPELLSRGQR